MEGCLIIFIILCQTTKLKTCLQTNCGTEKTYNISPRFQGDGLLKYETIIASSFPLWTWPQN